MKRASMFIARRNLLWLAATVLVMVSHAAASAAPIATTTSLTASGQTVTTGTAVVLMASVQAAGAPVAAGLVTFCDATATYCEGPAIFGSAQLLTNGSATLRHIFGPGNHSVKAVFAGIHAALASTSSAVSLSVSGTAPSSTVAASAGSAGNYSLTATVGYHGLAVPGLHETATFVDTTNSNYGLGSASVGDLTAPTYDFITIPTSPVTVGTLPSSVVTADFNGDGIPDFAVANLDDHTVSVFLGDGQGAFTQISGSPFAVGDGPAALAVADVNADGIPDIIAANSKDGTLSVLLANGSGGFTAGPSIPVGSGPQSITVGDFNGDGLPDLAVANIYDSTITVLMNNGVGGFTSSPSSVYPVGQNPAWIGAADFNQDGNLDLVMVNTTSNNITVLQGDGLGDFTPLAGSPFATLSYPVSAAIGDFNGDGLPDLAVLSGTGNQVSILLNSGTALVATGSPYNTGTSPSSIVVSDFNGDGKQDLVITNGNENDATVLFGDGTGAFSVGTQPIPDLRSPASLAVADFNGDGTQDLAITNLGGNSTSIRPLEVTQSATATLSSVVVPGAATTHLIAAKYEGDNLYAASTSPTISLIGSPISTTDTLSISPSSSVEYGGVLQLTASLAPPEAANYTASGTVRFFDGGMQIGQASLANGQALLSYNALSVASHALSAKYPGDANFTASNSSAVSVSVSKAATSITLTAMAGTGASFIYSATVLSTTGGKPTGTVTFFDGGSSLGSFSLTGGVATYSTSSLSAGVHVITATYGGDADYLTSTSGPVSASTGDFTLASNQQTNTVLPGKSVSYQLNLTPSSSFPNPITFSVTGLPAGAAASFSPETVTPGTANASTTMTVSVPAEVAGFHPFAPASGLTVALLLFPFAGMRRSPSCAHRRFRLMAVAFLLLGTFGSVVSLAGCGGGYLGQAPRNYTLTVTASSGTITHTTSVTLNVQ